LKRILFFLRTKKKQLEIDAKSLKARAVETYLFPTIFFKKTIKKCQ